MAQAALEAKSLRRLTVDQLNNRIFFRLFQAANVLQRQAMKQLGVTTVQWAVLGALSQAKFTTGIPFTELAEYLVVSRQNLDGVLKRLERDKLAERITGADDRRARLVRMTPKGRKFWNELSEQIFSFYDQAAARLKFDERVALLHHLNELQKNLMSVDLSDPKIARR